MRLTPFSMCARVLIALLSLAAMSAARAQAPAPAATSAAPAASTAPTKTLFLIRGPDGVVTAFRAVTSQLQGSILVLVNENGGRAVVQARTVVGQLPWHTDEEIASGAVDPGPLAARYELYARRIPALADVLGAEAARLRAVQKQRADAAAALQAAAADRLQAATADRYDADAGYTTETLAALLAPADALRAEDPSTATTLDAWAAPFRAHQEKLQAGRARVDGAWLTAEEIAARARTAREADFRRTLDAHLPGLALPADTVPGALRLVVIAAAAVMLAGLGLIVLARRRPSGLAAGLALLVAPPALLAAAFFLATRTPGKLPRTAPTTTDDDARVVKLLADAARIDPDVPPAEHLIPEAELNAFLAHRVHLERPAGAAPWAAVREALGVRLRPGGLAVFELLRCAGRPWIVRYDLTLDPAGGPPVLSRVAIGALDCPPALAQPLWRSLEPALVALLAAKPLGAHFAPPTIADGTIKFAPLAPAPAEPSGPVETPAPPSPSESPAPSSSSSSSPPAADAPGLEAAPAVNSPNQ